MLVWKGMGMLIFKFQKKSGTPHLYPTTLYSMLAYPLLLLLSWSKKSVTTSASGMLNTSVVRESAQRVLQQ